MLKQLLSFPMDSENTPQFEWLDYAVIVSDDVSTYAFSLSMRPAIIHTSGRQGTKVFLDSSMFFNSDLSVGGAQVKNLTEMGRMKSIYFNGLLPRPFVVRRNSSGGGEEEMGRGGEGEKGRGGEGERVRG